jgi:hypothetical protein
MINQRIVGVIWNKNAVVGQPIAFLVVFIIAGVILTLFFLSIPGLMKETHQQQIEAEINKIAVEASTMFEYTENGTSKSIPVKLPSSLRFIVFGSTPTQGTNEPTDLRLDERTSNNYYYVLNDGTIRLFHTTARFSNHNMTQIVIYHPGCFTITLQTRQTEGNTYVTMQ